MVLERFALAGSLPRFVFGLFIGNGLWWLLRAGPRMFDCRFCHRPACSTGFTRRTFRSLLAWQLRICAVCARERSPRFHRLLYPYAGIIPLKTLKRLARESAERRNA